MKSDKRLVGCGPIEKECPADPFEQWSRHGRMLDATSPMVCPTFKKHNKSRSKMDRCSSSHLVARMAYAGNMQECCKSDFDTVDFHISSLRWFSLLVCAHEHLYI